MTASAKTSLPLPKTTSALTLATLAVTAGMACIQMLLKAFAFCALNASLLIGAHAQVTFVLPEDPSCRTTPEMVHDGLMAVTDPNCLVANDEPGCNIFGLPDCRVCALMPEGIAYDVLPCELLDIFNEESEALGEESVNGEDCDYEPLLPPPLIPAKTVGATDPAESSAEEDYVPIVIVLPTDVIIEPESSIWADSESSDYGEAEVEQGENSHVTRHLRTQL